VDIPDYEAYRSFIINSRKTKEKRLDKQELWQAKEDRKELARLEKERSVMEQKLEKMKTASAGQAPTTGCIHVRDRYIFCMDIEDMEREIRRTDEQIKHLQARIAQDVLSKKSSEGASEEPVHERE
jgi:hypothetical protein